MVFEYFNIFFKSPKNNLSLINEYLTSINMKYISVIGDIVDISDIRVNILFVCILIIFGIKNIVNILTLIIIFVSFRLDLSLDYWRYLVLSLIVERFLEWLPLISEARLIFNVGLLAKFYH